ncbi:MAG: glycosyltransferase, partial [Acidobacteria bacterium]|nr:glycosyltransferase [Acidobacteriota bacterium]
RRLVRLGHQGGADVRGLVREGSRAAGRVVRVEPFLEEMDREMAAAQLVVCRAGATTLAELAAAGRPAVLVPFGRAANDHQRRNAAAVEAAGAAEVVDERELSGGALGARVLALASDADRRAALAAASRELARPDAASAVVDRMESLLALGDES